MTTRRTPRSVTSAIVLSTLGVVLFCCLALLGVQYWNSARELERQFREQVKLEASRLGVEYQRMVDDTKRHLAAIAEDNAIRVTLQLGVEYQLQERLAVLSSTARHAIMYVASRESGRIFSSTTQPVPAELPEILNAPKALTGRPMLASDGRIFLAMVHPVNNRAEVVGTAAALFFPGGPAAAGAGRNGMLLVSQLGVFRDLETGKPVVVDISGDSSSRNAPQPCTLDGEPGMVVDTGFMGVLYYAPLAPLVESQRANIATSFFLLLGTVAVCGLLSFVIGTRITRSLRTLAETARTISLGESRLPLLDASSPLAEVNDVVHAMEAMLVNLRQAEELGRYRTLFEEVVDGVFIFDLDGRILECNSQAMQQMGCSREHLLELSVIDLAGVDSRQSMWQMLEMARETPAGSGLAAKQFEVRIRPVEGQPFHAEIHVRKLHYMEQEVVLSVVRDISTRVAAETALRKAKQDAEEASRAKSGFLASMSHEIRTPMHSVLGLVDMLEDTGLSVEQSRYLDMLRSSGVLLLNLIDDILDFSKIEAGHLELEHIVFNVDSVFERIFAMVNMQAAQKGLEIILYMEPEVPPRLVGDPTRLQQIMVNLLSNALKFTSLGHIITTVAVRRRAEEEVELEISVKDTGIGIQQNKQQAIFDAFTQADSTTARKFGGTGLGLAITKRLVERLGGDISVESRSGHGSTFLFTAIFPLPESGAERSVQRPFKGRRFLLVDDNAITLHYLSRTLSNLGATSREAASVQEAVSMLGSSVEAGSAVYDCVIMGSDLPELDGVSAHRQIAKHMGMSMPPTLLYVDLQHAAQGGKALPVSPLPVLTKPATPSRLAAAVEAAMAGGALLAVENEAASRHPEEDGQGVGRLLVAEDSSANRMLMEFYLKKASVRLDFAEDGKEAVEMYRDNRYDVVFMDIQMPGMDGYAATQAIRAFEEQEGFASVPIIALTANAYAEDREKCLAAGCTDYLPKPAKKRVVLEKLRQYL